MYYPQNNCPNCPTVRHALPRKTTSLQSLSCPRATLRMLRDLMTRQKFSNAKSQSRKVFSSLRSRRGL